MPYYFGQAFDTYFSYTYDVNSIGCSYRPTVAQFEMCIDDLLDWADMKFGEAGDCEHETNPKSSRSSYNVFPPKHSDQTKYGTFLRNFINMADIPEDTFTPRYNIYNYIFDNLNINTLELLFHSLTIEYQQLYIQSIPNMQQDLRNHFNSEAIRINANLNEITDDENLSDDDDDENLDEDDDENLSDEEEEETQRDDNSAHTDANRIINYIGEMKFDDMLTICEDINNGNKTVTDLFSYVQREFSQQLENYWDNIVITCESYLYGKLDEAYVDEFIEIPEAPMCSWDRQDQESDSSEEDFDSSNEEEEEGEEEEEDDMPEILSPSHNDSFDINGSIIEPIPISDFNDDDINCIIDDDVFAHLEDAHITVRRNRYPPRTIRV